MMVFGALARIWDVGRRAVGWRAPAAVTLLALHLGHCAVEISDHRGLLAAIAVLSVAVVLGLALAAPRALIAFTFAVPLLGSFHKYLAAPNHPPLQYLVLPLIAGYLLWRERQGRTANPERRPGLHWFEVLLICFSVAAACSAAIAIPRFAGVSPWGPYVFRNHIVNVLLKDAWYAGQAAFNQGLNYAVFAPLYFIYKELVAGAARRLRLAQALTLGVLCALPIGLIQIFTDRLDAVDPFWVEIGRTINATFDDPNALGIFLGLALPLGLASALASRGRLRLLSCAALPPLLICLVHSGSRSGFLTALLSVVVFAVLAIPARFHRPDARQGAARRAFGSLVAVSAAIGISLAALGAVFFAAKHYEGENPLLTRLKEDALSVESQANNFILESRGLFWREAIHMARDYPLGGIGAGTYVIQLPNYYQLDGVPSDKRWVDAAGSLYLNVAAELGLPGLLLICLILGGLGLFLLSGREAVRDREDWNGFVVYASATAAFTALALSMAFGMHTHFFSLNVVFWGLAGVVVAAVDQTSAAPAAQCAASRWLKRGGLALAALLIVGSLFPTHAGPSNRRVQQRVKWPDYYGMHAPEAADSHKPFAWTKQEAGLILRAHRPVMTLPLRAMNHDIRQHPLTVWVYANDLLLDEIVLRDDDWHSFNYALPMAPGQDFWLKLRTSRVWRPLDWDAVDVRRLGVQLGNISWAPAPAAKEWGFHPWEEDESGAGFRWMKVFGAMRAPKTWRPLRFYVRATNPSLAQQPQRLRIYFNGFPIQELVIDADQLGKWLPIDLANVAHFDPRWHGWESPTIFLSADYSWRPRDDGLGAADDRSLSVQVSGFETR